MHIYLYVYSRKLNSSLGLKIDINGDDRKIPAFTVEALETSTNLGIFWILSVATLKINVFAATHVAEIWGTFCQSWGVYNGNTISFSKKITWIFGQLDTFIVVIWSYLDVPGSYG